MSSRYLRSDCDGRRSGFTLVELLLATALMGMVLLAIFSSYAAGIRVWRAIKDSDISGDRRFFIGTEKIRMELSAYIRDFGDIEFEGKMEELTFPSISGLDILKITYEFDKNGDVLLKKAVKYSDSLKEKMNEEITELLEAEDVEFYYLFYDPEEDTAQWVSDFTKEDNGIPEAVRLDITKDGEEFSEYVFLPR
ncbi:MAG: prepilin-type N-terminal cleavage/methylation domain-containing protein [Candidatus Omnitrophica bacterium]|nr:prepilin-type N-terminal cleavage/methylation domain-containing protein [Candidatus Omnitrophota bacterium]